MTSEDPRQPVAPWADDYGKVEWFIWHLISRGTEPGGLTTEQLAELRGAIHALIFFHHISHAAARVLLEPIIGQKAAESWLSVTTVRVVGEPQEEDGAEGAADE